MLEKLFDSKNLIKKILTAGGSGMLGSTLYEVFTQEGISVVSTDINPLDPWTDYLDVRHQQRVKEMILREKPDAVLNLAALTDLEYCETHPDEAYQVNTLGAENVALACAEAGIPLVHISTAGVFDGTKNTPYTEADQPNPINVYGRSKYEAEKIVRRLVKKHFIFRAGWMMGGGERDKKFVKKIIDQINAGKALLYVVNDKMGCPTYTLDFARGILRLLKTEDYGLYHMVSEGSSSRYWAAKKIIEILALDGVSIKAVSSDYEEIKKTFFVPRARSEILENKKLKEKGIKIMRSWDSALKDYLAENFNNEVDFIETSKADDLVARQEQDREVFTRYEPGFELLPGPRVSVVTTAYNNEKFNPKYFEMINSQSYSNIEVIFVDNNSADRTVASAKRLLRNGKIIASKINSGCAGGNNLGATEAEGSLLFFFAPDAWMDPYCVERLVKVSKEHPGDVLAPKQMSYDGITFISCGLAVDFLGYPQRTHTADGEKQLRRVFFADGSGIFLAKENYFLLGMMDEATFLFHEDVDLSWKAHLLGLGVVPVAEAVIYHWIGASIGMSGFPRRGEIFRTNYNRRFLAERNMIRNILKNYEALNLFWILPVYLLINLAEMVLLLFFGQGKSVFKVYLRSYWWNVANLKSTRQKRRQIQVLRKVSDVAIFGQVYFFPSKLRALLEIGIPRLV